MAMHYFVKLRLAKDGSVLFARNDQILSIVPSGDGSIVHCQHGREYLVSQPPAEIRNAMSTSLANSLDRLSGALILEALDAVTKHQDKLSKIVKVLANAYRRGIA
jgi:hypothetical protein